MNEQEYIGKMLATSYDNYGIDYHIDRDVYERIYLDGVKTGIAVMLSSIDKFIDSNNNKK